MCYGMDEPRLTWRQWLLSWPVWRDRLLRWSLVLFLLFLVWAAYWRPR